MTAKTTPYPPCTVTALCLKYQDPTRCSRRVTQPPHIAGPLGVKTLAHNKFSFIKIYLGKARDQLRSWYSDICANGPAIWGGCVTRRTIRAESWYFSRKVVPVQGGYGVVFAVMAQILLSITRVAVQV